MNAWQPRRTAAVSVNFSVRPAARSLRSGSSGWTRAPAVRSPEGRLVHEQAACSEVVAGGAHAVGASSRPHVNVGSLEAAPACAGNGQAPEAKPAASSARRLVLTCDICRQPITGRGTGYAIVDLRAAGARAKALRQWREQNPRVPISKGPKPVRWHLLHAGCDTHPDAHYFYRLPAERIRSERQLLVQTIALAPKQWFPHSDWRRLVKRILKANGGT
jgi:hypothetical protein